MRREMRLLVVLFALALVAPAQLSWAHGEDRPVALALAAIDSAQAGGGLSSGEAMLSKLSLIHPSSLSPRPLGLQGSPIRCATSIYIEAKRNLSAYPMVVQGDVSGYLQRPQLNASIDTRHFRIHYSTTGPNAVLGWPGTAYRDSVASAAERSWRFYHQTQAWRTPPSDGTKGGGENLIDIYLDDLGTSAYGYAVPEDSAPQNGPDAATAFLVIDNDYRGFSYADPGVPMKVTVAHEYHHVVQMGYTTDSRWWMENLSTYMENEVYPAIGDSYQYLGCYTSQPYLRLSTINGCFEYGCFLWPTFLQENWDGSVLQDIQTCAATGDLSSCFDRVLSGRGSDFASALADWSVWNFYTYQRDDRQHYAGGSGFHFYMAYDKEIRSYPLPDTHPSPMHMPEAAGTSVQRFDRVALSSDNRLVISYRGPACTHQVMVIVKEAGRAVFHENVMSLDAHGSGTVEIVNWDRSEFAHMIVSLPQSCGDGAFDYVFNAHTENSSAVNDPPLYTRTIVLDQNTPNPFGPETRINYRLGEGGAVSLTVFDAGGRQVRSLIQGHEDAGAYSVRWDGRDDGGRLAAPGIYFYRLNAGGQRQVRKMIVER